MFPVQVEPDEEASDEAIDEMPVVSTAQDIEDEGEGDDEDDEEEGEVDGERREHDENEKDELRLSENQHELDLDTHHHEHLGDGVEHDHHVHDHLGLLDDKMHVDPVGDDEHLQSLNTRHPHDDLMGSLSHLDMDFPDSWGT